MIYILNESGNFLHDDFDPEGFDNWTSVAPPQPCVAPYMVGERLETGEWVGEWHDIEDEAVINVPKKVSMRQARLALLQAGLLYQVETLIQGMEGTEGAAARIEWDYSSEVWRNKPFVVSLGAALQLSEADLDALFITAAGIE